MEEKNRMQVARERAELESPAAAAKKIGCSRTLINAWESGESDPKKSSFSYAAAVAYKVRPEWIKDPTVPDGFPWSPEAVNDAPYLGVSADSPAPDQADPVLDNELRAAVAALARVLASTRLDVAAALEDELGALQGGRYLETLIGIVGREHAKLKRQRGGSPKAQGSKKHSRA